METVGQQFWKMDAPPGDPLTHQIIGAAIEVHRTLGPGLLESAYEECLCFELAQHGLSLKRQVPLGLIYKTQKLDLGFRPDVIVEEKVLVELKCIEKLMPVHQAQLLTYLRLSGLKVGLLINFQSQPLVNGIKRMVL